MRRHFSRYHRWQLNKKEIKLNLWNFPLVKESKND